MQCSAGQASFQPLVEGFASCGQIPALLAHGALTGNKPESIRRHGSNIVHALFLRFPKPNVESSFWVRQPNK